jgi:hypothetical protein
LLPGCRAAPRSGDPDTGWKIKYMDNFAGLSILTVPERDGGFGKGNGLHGL